MHTAPPSTGNAPHQPRQQRPGWRFTCHPYYINVCPPQGGSTPLRPGGYHPPRQRPAPDAIGGLLALRPMLPHRIRKVFNRDRGAGNRLATLTALHLLVHVLAKPDRLLALRARGIPPMAIAI